MTLVKDTVTPGHARYNEKAARAKLAHSGAEGREGKWGAGAADQMAHGNDKMTCFTCHLSWTTSCAGGHLPLQANCKTERTHYGGAETPHYSTSKPHRAAHA